MQPSFPNADGTARAAWALAVSTLQMLRDKGLASDAEVAVVFESAVSLVSDQTNISTQHAQRFLLEAQKTLLR